MFPRRQTNEETRRYFFYQGECWQKKDIRLGNVTKIKMQAAKCSSIVFHKQVQLIFTVYIEYHYDCSDGGVSYLFLKFTNYRIYNRKTDNWMTVQTLRPKIL